MADLSWYGAPDGIEIGTAFLRRRDVYSAHVHRHLQAGIVGTRERGAESIVVSGGYEDDEDYGDVIIYTGQGGNDPTTTHQTADQLFDKGNAALVTSALTGVPVRVVRGHGRHSSMAPAEGYRYDGLFRVESWWSEKGKSGFKICRFRLVSTTDAGGHLSTALTSAPASTPSIGATPVGTAVPSRVSTVVQRVVRSSRVVEYVKKLHDHTCQMCGTRLSIGGRGYAEGAHVRAIGRPHDGPDEPSNVLCLCPNCHVLFDNGGITITDDFVVRHCAGSESPLRLADEHTVDPAHIAYHRGIHC